MLDTSSRTLSTLFAGFAGLAGLAACAALTFVGCGESDDGGGGTFSSGLPPSTPLNELTDQQRGDFCEEAQRFSENYYSDADFERLGCITLALLAGSFDGGESACQQAFDDCVANPPPLDEEESEFTCELEDLPETCDITIAEYETCINDSAVGAEELLDAFSCSNVNWETGEIEGVNDELPASCAAFEERCSTF